MVSRPGLAQTPCSVTSLPMPNVFLLHCFLSTEPPTPLGTYPPTGLCKEQKWESGTQAQRSE